MQRRAFLFFLLICAFVYSAVCSVLAQPRPDAKFRHADKNKDGTVDKKEVQMEQQWEAQNRLTWRQGRSKANTTLERKYDANGDGWLEAAESRQMLQDKYTLIKTDGKAKVDSPIEAAYDVNADGIIDASEAGALQDDLQD